MHVQYAPLAYAAGVCVAAMLTFGAGLLLAFATFPLSVLHLRQVSAPRGATFWIGFALNTLLFAAIWYWLVVAVLTGEA